MSAVPPPSRRVLDELRPNLPSAGTDARDTTPVARAFVRLEAALDAHLSELTERDRIEDIVVATHGYPRVPFPAAPGAAPEYAADERTIGQRLGAGRPARRLTAELRQRQDAFAKAAEEAGLTLAREREALTARDLSDAAAGLLLAPVERRADLSVKLMVLIAAGEAGPDEARTFPWVYLRALLADV